MKNLFSFIFLLFVVFTAKSQCSPDPLCVDDGEPGQICPDTLPDGRVNEFYFQTITIWAPSSIDYQGSTINLSHLKIASIGNIPAGLTWECNATDNLLAVGTSYCVLIQGTPETVGVYPLGIEVQPYIFSIPMPTTIVDDTSLSITINPELGIYDLNNNGFIVQNPYPNPFTNSTEIIINSSRQGNLYFNVFDRLGINVLSGEMEVKSGKNILDVRGESLAKGVYFYSIMFDNRIVTGKLVKI